jgi:hypothetical protein
MSGTTFSGKKCLSGTNFMLFDLTFPCYLTTFSGKKGIGGKFICAFFVPLIEVLQYCVSPTFQDQITVSIMVAVLSALYLLFPIACLHFCRKHQSKLTWLHMRWLHKSRSTNPLSAFA